MLGMVLGVGEKTLHLRVRDLDWLDVQGEVVALDGEKSRYLAANRTGALLWAQLDQGATRDQLVDRLLAEFNDLDEGAAQRDVDAFLSELRAHDLLEE